MQTELLALLGRKRSPELDPVMLPHIVREYLNVCSKITDARPGMLLTAWLPYLGVCIGNKIHMLSSCQRIYPNLWSCLIGPSSVSRKTTAIRLAELTMRKLTVLLEALSNEEFEAQTPILSNVTLSKLFSLLALNPVRLFVHHELSGWLGEMGKQFNTGYKQAITEIYDCVNKSVHTQTRTERIRKPAFNVVASTTEAWIYRHIRETADQLGGFLQRFLYCVIRDVNLDVISLDFRAGSEEERGLVAIGKVMQVLRDIPGEHRLCLDSDAIKLRNEEYSERYKKWFATNNDSLMSYFTRLYDGYFYKFCIIFTLLENWEEIDRAQQQNRCPEFMSALRVNEETALNAVVLCDFYFQNTLPLLEIVEEQDKLAVERKLVDLLVNQYSGKAAHSELLNRSHLRKREFREAIESLIEREAITVESYKNLKSSGKLYVLNPVLLADWQKKDGDKLTL